MFDAIAHNSNYFTSVHAQETADKNTAENAAEFRDVKQQEATQKTRTLPGQQETGADGQPKDRVQLSQEAEEIRRLQARDREVRAHEAAHAAVGGSYAGSPSYSFERGPDGKTYATGGEVSISVSPIPGDPDGTLQKAQQVRAAALAPAQPSAQDMKVAQRAQAMAAQARIELSQETSEKLAEVSEKQTSEANEGKEAKQPASTEDSSSTRQGASSVGLSQTGPGKETSSHIENRAVPPTDHGHLVPERSQSSLSGSAIRSRLSIHA